MICVLTDTFRFIVWCVSVSNIGCPDSCECNGVPLLRFTKLFRFFIQNYSQKNHLNHKLTSCVIKLLCLTVTELNSSHWFLSFF